MATAARGMVGGGPSERAREEDGQTGRVGEMSGPNTRAPHVRNELKFVWT